jgi:hypothetical protein
MTEFPSLLTKMMMPIESCMMEWQFHRVKIIPSNGLALDWFHFVQRLFDNPKCIQSQLISKQDN